MHDDKTSRVLGKHTTCCVVISPAEAVSEWHQRRTQGPRSAAILNLGISPGFEVAVTCVWSRIQDGVKKVNLGSIHFAVQYSAQGTKYKAFSFQSKATIQTYSLVWPLTFKQEEDSCGIVGSHMLQVHLLISNVMRAHCVCPNTAVTGNYPPTVWHISMKTHISTF